MALTLNEKKDLVLNEIKNHYGYKPIPENWKRICSLVTDGNGIDTGNFDYEYDPQLKNIIEFLKKHEYVVFFQNVDGSLPYLVATVKGLEFEGFVQKEKDDKRKKAVDEYILSLTTKSLEDSRKIWNTDSKRTMATGLVGAILGVILTMGTTKCSSQDQKSSHYTKSHHGKHYKANCQ